MMMIQNFGDAIPAAPSSRPTPEQYDAARRYVAAYAPDLFDAIFGSDR